MSFSGVATSACFALHRLHRAAVVTADGVEPVDGLLTGPIALAAVGKGAIAKLEKRAKVLN